jgi:hypothetical protein
VYNYHDTSIREERVARGTDHCASNGPVFELSTILSNRRLHDPRDPRKLLEQSSNTTIIFAVNTEHKLHLAFDGRRGESSAVKHETLFHNANVLAAGELEVREGTIVGLNDHSGSYGTYGKLDSDPSFATAVLLAVKLSGAPLTGALRQRLRRRSRHGRDNVRRAHRM